MKLAADSLLEIISIVQKGLLQLQDVSEELRALDFNENIEGKLGLSQQYLESKKEN